MDGKTLQEVISATGLPEDQVATWLNGESQQRGHTGPEMTLDELRDLLADILQDMILATDCEEKVS